MKKIFLFVMLSFCLLSETNISKTRIESLVKKYNQENKTDLNFQFDEETDDKQLSLKNNDDGVRIVISNVWFSDLMEALNKSMKEKEVEERFFQEVFKAHISMNFKVHSDLDNGVVRQIIFKNEIAGVDAFIFFNRETKLYLSGLFPTYRENRKYGEFFFYLEDNL